MLKRRKILVAGPNMAIEVSDDFDETLSKPSEVLVRNRFSHISAGTELACIAGMESFFTIPGTPGYTSVGEVMDAGDGAGDLFPGDMVFTFGPHAEYFKIDTGDRWHGICIPLPEGMDPELAAFAHMGGIAITALRKSRIELGDDVLVTGLGVIGNLAAQLAQLQGGRVMAADINGHRIALAMQCGINTVLNSASGDLKSFVDEQTGGHKVSTYIDASGMASVIEASMEILAQHGEVILLGSPREPHETNLTRFLQYYHNYPWYHTLKGALEFSYPTHQDEFSKHSIERNSKIIITLILEKKLLIKPIYSHKIKPSGIQAAYDGLREQPDEFVGVIIDWD